MPFLKGMTSSSVIASTITSPIHTGMGPRAKMAEIIAAMNTMCWACATGSFRMPAWTKVSMPAPTIMIITR